MTWRRWTAAVIVCGVAGWIVWDLIVVSSTDGATISRVILDWAYDWPTIPTAVGVLCGHWFWPVYQYRHEGRGAWRYWLLGGLGVLLLVLDLVWLDRVFPLIPLAIGVPIGHFLWTQKLEA